MVNSTTNFEGAAEISIDEAKNNLKEFEIIDVRRPDEFIGELGHIQGAKLVTLETDFSKMAPKLDKAKTYLFVCRSGGRSSRATLIAAGFGIQGYNMAGGMIAWNHAKFPTEK